jgi:integrase
MQAPIALSALTGMRKGHRVYLRETKNGSLRVLPLNVFASGVLASLPPGGPGDDVLAGVNPQKLSVYTKRLFARIGIEDASFHSLRHTAASWLVMEGADLYAVGQLLGHNRA